MTDKRCAKCRLTKPLVAVDGKPNFDKLPGRKGDGYHAWCRACVYAGNKARRARRRAERGAVASIPATNAAVGKNTCLADGPNLRAFDAEQPRIEVVQETITEVEEHRLKARIRASEDRVKRLISELSDERARVEMVEAARAARGAVVPIEPRQRASGHRPEATALVLASDWHVEEEVRPEQVVGRNRYNLEIAEQRMRRFFEAVRWGNDFNRQAFDLRDVVLWLGGDIITGYLHPDNVEANLLSPVRAIAFAHEHIAAGIRFLLQDPQLERLVIPCNDGNHGRLTERMRSSTRVANSIEWSLYHELAREFRDEPRVQFVIAEGEQLYLQVYGRTIRFTHGDTVRYQGGVGGITIPLFKARDKWDSVQRADLTCCGHFHQLISLADLIVNGSLIGYGPYSLTVGARFEPPAQAYTLLEPRRFKSYTMPLWVSERDDDVSTRS